MVFENLSDKTLDVCIKNQETIVRETLTKIRDLKGLYEEAQRGLGSETLRLNILRGARNNRRKYAHKVASQ